MEDLDYELNGKDLYPINETESRPIVLKDSRDSGNYLYFLENNTIHDSGQFKHSNKTF